MSSFRGTSYTEQKQEDALARLIYEALAQVGRQADASVLAERIKRLDLGLPVEDEFIVVLKWLGKCQLIHKLDQAQIPPASSARYRVPDLLVAFDYQGRIVPALIEVKGKYSKAFSWRPDYVEGLRQYGKLLDLPVLIACKWKSFGCWSLTDLDQYEQVNKSYKYSFKNTLKNNLMSILAGDFSVVLKQGVGLHLKMFKEANLGRMETENIVEEEWVLHVKELFIINPLGEQEGIRDSGFWPFLFTANLVTQTVENKDHFVHSFIVHEEEPMQRAHDTLLVLLSNFVSDKQPLNWREILSQDGFPMGIPELYKAASEGICRYVRYVIHQMPETMPAFLNQKGA